MAVEYVLEDVGKVDMGRECNIPFQIAVELLRDQNSVVEAAGDTGIRDKL